MRAYGIQLNQSARVRRPRSARAHRRADLTAGHVAASQRVPRIARMSRPMRSHGCCQAPSRSRPPVTSGTIS